MARFNFEFEDDFYFALNVTRTADRSEIRRNYRLIARDVHPDNFVDEMKFDPEGLSVKELLSYLESERVGVATAVDKRELVEKAWVSHRRTQNVDEGLARRREEITGRFALLNEAYTTLYDDKKRKMYDLSGDWGIPGLSGKRKGDGGIGDREEAERVRERGRAAQRDKVQERVYQRYMKEKEEEAQVEVELTKKREERKAREAEEGRKKREEMGLKPLEDMTEEEIRIENQEQIKAMWGNLFSNIFGGGVTSGKE